MITIDGSLGEGGGQVLRTALSLSIITGEPATIVNIRAKRKKPGLMRQHLTAVLAAGEICGGGVSGAEVGSTELVFRPGRACHGAHTFSIGTAGSATLVLQTVLPPLLRPVGQSYITLEGGTHNPLAPPYDFLERAFLPLLAEMGAATAPRLHRHGFYPAGGGKMTVGVTGGELRPLSLTRRRGDPVLKAACLYSALSAQIPQREAAVLDSRLPGLAGNAEIRRVNSPGPGNAAMVDVASGREDGGKIVEVFTAFGERGVSAENVAADLARQVEEYLASEAAVGRHLADQLLLPLALAGGGEFTTLSPSQHTLTNIEVIQAFLPIRFTVRKIRDNLHTVTC